MKPKIASIGLITNSVRVPTIAIVSKQMTQFSDRAKLLLPPPRIATFDFEWNQSSANLLPASSWKPTPQLPGCYTKGICWVATDGATNVQSLLLVFKQSHYGSNSIALFSSSLSSRLDDVLGVTFGMMGECGSSEHYVPCLLDFGDVQVTIDVSRVMIN